MVSITLNKKIKELILVSVFISLLMVASCKVDVESPNNLITKTTAFSNDASAISALLGIYTTLSATTLNDPTATATLFTGLASDELTYNATTSFYAEYSTNSIQSSNPFLQTHWTTNYKIIYQCNQLLDALKGKNSVSVSTVTQLTGEALFIRSLIYFYLINEFGDVPLVITPNYDIAQNLPRTPIADVQKQILSDLLTAQSTLSDTYPSIGKARVNKSAVTSFLAKFYLYQRMYKEAETAASQVITSGMYSLEPDLNNVFLATSKEAILQFIPSQSGYNTALGNMFIPSSATSVPNYSVSSNLLSSIELGDKRRNVWMIDRVVKNNNYTYPAKYKIARSATVTEYTTILRLADLYLIRAEARAQQGNVADALDDLNLIRSRARDNLVVNALPNVPKSISQTEALQAIIKERRIELFAEGPNRWIDLKRLNLLDGTMKALRPSNWQTTDQLFPIPNGEILLNQQLKQNPGYN